MVKTILVGLDGLPHSEAALRWSVRQARRANAMLIGIGIVDEPEILQPALVPMGASYYQHHSTEAKVMNAHRHVVRVLDHFTRYCAEADVACKPLEGIGRPQDEILREVQRCDLVALGRRTTFGADWGEDWSHTLRAVVRDCPRPVVAVSATDVGPGPVLVAYDGSPQAARALYGFAESQIESSMPIYVVTLGPNRINAGKTAHRAIEYLDAHGLMAEPMVIVTREPPGEILLEKEKELSAGLIVMGAYGQPTFREFIFGSTTRWMMEHAHAPLLMFH